MPEKLVVTAKVPKNEKKGTKELGPATVSVECGATAKEMIEMFGDEAVKTNAIANWVVTLQSNIRGGLNKGETQEVMQARLGSAKMGVSSKGVKVDPMQVFLAQFDAGTPEEQMEMMKGLQKRAAERKAAK